MALLNTHTDYMNFGEGELGFEEYPHEKYVDFLKYLKSEYAGHYYHALPNELAGYFASTSAFLAEKLDRNCDVYGVIK